MALVLVDGTEQLWGQGAPGGPSDRREVNQSDVEELSGLAGDCEWIKLDVERAEAHSRGR
jgi:acyl dehydratase